MLEFPPLTLVFDKLHSFPDFFFSFILHRRCPSPHLIYTISFCLFVCFYHRLLQASFSMYFFNIFSYLSKCYLQLHYWDLWKSDYVTNCCKTIKGKQNWFTSFFIILCMSSHVHTCVAYVCIYIWTPWWYQKHKLFQNIHWKRHFSSFSFTHSM